MILAAEKELCHVGETAGIADHDHDLVHELSRRLDALWRYDQYIANAEWRDELKHFWRDAKAMEQQAIQRIRELIAQEAIHRPRKAVFNGGRPQEPPRVSCGRLRYRGCAGCQSSSSSSVDASRPS